MKTPFSPYKPKKVVIVGAGMSGMTAGIYLRDNGFDVEIYEKHSIAGGECTGWVREGQYIDGCAHWIIGTNPNSCLYPIWDHIGAFQNARILPTEALTTYDIGGKNFVFHSDIKKLEEDLIALSPEDIAKRADLEDETVAEVLDILRKEFEDE